MKNLSALLLVASLLLPATAQAHVTLRRSDPGAGAILTATPLVLRFWFTEQVELAVTRVTLVDQAGKVFGVAEPVAMENNEQGGVQLQLYSPLNAGVYKVTWHTVALDGHAASGAFTFRILDANEVMDTAFAAAAARAQRDTALAEKRAAEAAKPVDVLAMRSASPVYIVARAFSFISLLLLIGAAGFWLLVLRPTQATDPATWKRIVARLASSAILAALAYMLFACVRLFLQTQLVSGNSDPDLGDFTNLIFRTNWGIAWRTQMACAVVICLVLLLQRTLKAFAWWFSIALVVTIAFATSLTSHAGSSEVLRTFGVINDASHVLAIGCWLGGLFWMIAVALPTLAGVEHRTKRTTAIVHAFSKIALWCVGVMLFSGVVSTYFRVGSIGNLVSSTYGQTLIIKLLLVAGVAGVGYYNWRTLRPALGNEGGPDALRKSARMELAVAILVIIATAALVGLPLPGSS